LIGDVVRHNFVTGAMYGCSTKLIVRASSCVYRVSDREGSITVAGPGFREREGGSSGVLRKWS